MAETNDNQESQSVTPPTFLEVVAPCDPEEYVGFGEVTDFLQDFAREFRNRPEHPRLLVVEGVPGSGRSSTLRKMESYLVYERYRIGKIQAAPPQEGEETTLIEQIKTCIDETAPDWRGRFTRGKGYEDIPAMALDGEIEMDEAAIVELANLFFDNIAKINEKLVDQRQTMAILIDGIDQLLHLGGKAIPHVLEKIAEQLHETNTRILLVVTCDLDVFQKSPAVATVALDRMPFADADQFLRGRTGLNTDQRQKVVRNSSRFPFNLMFRAQLAKERQFPMYLEQREFALVLGLDQVELGLLNWMGAKEMNWFAAGPVEDTAFAPGAANLVQNGILKQTAEHYYTPSDSIWTLLTTIFTPLDEHSVLELALDDIQKHAQDGVKPSYLDLPKVAGLIHNIRDLARLHAIAQTVGLAAADYIKHELYETAFDLGSLVLNALEQAEDFEKAGDFAEELAKVYSNAGDVYHAAVAHEKAGDFFHNADVKWRVQHNYREAGLRYRKLAEEQNVKLNHFVIRSFLKKSFVCYQRAGEKQKSTEVCNMAKKILKEYPSHVTYFEAMEISG